MSKPKGTEELWSQTESQAELASLTQNGPNDNAVAGSSTSGPQPAHLELTYPSYNPGTSPPAYRKFQEVILQFDPNTLRHSSSHAHSHDALASPTSSAPPFPSSGVQQPPVIHHPQPTATGAQSLTSSQNSEPGKELLLEQRSFPSKWLTKDRIIILAILGAIVVVVAASVGGVFGSRHGAKREVGSGTTSSSPDAPATPMSTTGSSISSVVETTSTVFVDKRMISVERRRRHPRLVAEVWYNFPYLARNESHNEYRNDGRNCVLRSMSS